MKKILLIICLPLLFLSCENYLDKSILNKLSDSEIKSSLKNDSIVFNINQFFSSKITDSILSKNSELKNKLLNVSYRDLYDLQKLTSNKSYFDSIKEYEIQPKWKIEYEDVITKIDSLYRHYYSNPIDLSKYIKIELSKIDTDYYSYSGGVEDVDMGFKLTPLKGTVQQLIFEYTYKPKIGGKEYSHRCRTTKPITRSVVRWWNVDYSEENILGGETPYTIKRDYDFDIKVLKIRYKDENLSNDESDIPFEIRMYKKYIDENNDSMTDLYIKDISNEILNLEYKSLNEYFRPIQDSIIKSKISNYNKIQEVQELLLNVMLKK